MKLSALGEDLIPWLETKEDWRPHVINWAKSFVKEGLQDRAITRDLDWGIDIPVDDLGDGKKIYVWFEAVIGYLSASIEWSNNDESRNWEDWWKNKDAESYYFIGKDNVPFHSVIWPAILAGYGDLNLPTNVPATQYILIKGEKASARRSGGKSLSENLEEWQPDAIRYTLASVLPEQADSELSESEMIRRNNEELVKLAHDIKKSLQKYQIGRVVVENTGNIGKSYRKHDEIGTPLCMTIDFDSLEKNTLTIRDRDSMEQKTIKMDDVEHFFINYFSDESE